MSPAMDGFIPRSYFSPCEFGDLFLIHGFRFNHDGLNLPRPLHTTTKGRSHPLRTVHEKPNKGQLKPFLTHKDIRILYYTRLVSKIWKKREEKLSQHYVIKHKPNQKITLTKPSLQNFINLYKNLSESYNF